MHPMDRVSFLYSAFIPALVSALAFSSVWADGPRLRRPVFYGSVQENWPIGTTVNGLNIHLNRINPEPWCSMVAGRKWRLQLIGEDRSHFDIYFHHRYAQLSLKTTQVLDREVRSMYVFKLGLCCKLCLSQDSIATELALVTVHVLDVNDNAPQFTPTMSKITLDETTRLKSVVYRVNAEDPDLGNNADLVYFADPVNTYFFVIPKTGQVVLVESILNVKKAINLTIFARDHGQPPLVSAPLEVEISPRVKMFTVPEKEESYLGYLRQKRSPQLPDSFYTVSLPEDTSVGSAVTTLVDTKFDTPVFELVSPSPVNSPIAVDRDSGKITLFSTLDRESAASHECLIRVMDRTGNDWYLVHLDLTVKDVNDESPVWTMNPSPFLAVVSPNAVAGTYVYKLHATDKDEGVNGEVEYFLLQGGEDRFAVDRKSGWIQSTGQPLLENDEYLLTVQAADRLGKKSPPVTVFVIAGLRPPQFKKTSYSVHIPENTPPGYALMTVSALSHQNKSLSYSVITNPHNLFSVHHLTGEVTLTQSVDYESDPKDFLLIIRASENLEQLSSTVEVRVTITDVNDCIPEFQQTIYSKDNVPETVAVMTSILQVMATDCDSGVNGEVSYYTLNPDFSISALGIISPVRELDYERPSHLYEFVVLAVDHGEEPNTGTTTVRIRVSNMNDEAPEFSQAIYRTFISEDAGPDTLVATVHAYDPDGDQVTYDILEGNLEGNFIIDPQKGLIRLHSSLLPRLHGTEYVLCVTATDDNSSGGPHSLTSTTTVIVRVDDVNNNKPVFHKCVQYRDHAAVLENQPPGTFVLQVEAIDADEGANGQVKYGIVHREGTLPAFSIHPDTGILTTVQSFDREKQKEYPVTIKATDQAAEPLIGLCQINIVILDENDNDPSFENNRYEYFLREDTALGTSFLRIAAHDDDYGVNAAITYSVASQEPIFFHVNSSTGWLYVSRPISRKSLITEEIIATDGGNRSTRVEVTVRVTDAQNQPPVWEKDRYEMVVPENTLRDTPVVTVKASCLLEDPRVTYNLEEGLVPESNMPVRFYLTVNREEGSASVLIAEPLDYETTKNFVLKIRAQNVAPVPLAAFTTVYINVTDVNDNVPFFTSSIYEASVTEGLSLGTFVLQVSASDQDLGLNGKITYSVLEDRSGDHALFHIDVQTGAIFTASVFDRETKDSYLLEIKSSDGSESARPGKHGQPNSDTAYVRIFISDVNDNKPSFTQSAYYVNVDEDQDVGSIAITVSANDPDEGMNAQIRYQITAGNVGGVLDVDPETGSIFLFQQLDYEEVKIYELTLLASDGRWEDYATVTINVINKNDEAPVFSLNEYHGKLVEGLLELPVLVLQVSATDPDNEAWGTMKYSLHGSGADNVFTIDEKTGNILAQKTLDREEHALWRFVVLATDEEGEGLTGFADVIIYVGDINDNSPHFTCAIRNCTASVFENVPVSTFVIEMGAVDLDDKNEGKNAILTYSLVNNALTLMSLDMFSINANTGTIYTLRNLDREENDTYFLIVEAKDGGGLSTTGTATIKVLDVNDHVPKFTQETWRTVILETNEINSDVLQLFAVDEDIEENALLTFSIIHGDPDQKFTIERVKKTKQARIKLKKKLDYEHPQERWFNLTIKVEDTDFYSTAFCLIELQDCNDNAPVFIAPFVQLAPLLENLTVGSILTQVTASDADSGIYGHVVYSIHPNSDTLQEFHVDQDGFVRVKKPLDREVKSQYNLVILASDQGSPAQTGTATVSFNLLDVNDNGPVFDASYMPIVWENMAWPQTVHMNETSDLLYAVDYDTVENGQPFTFSLPSHFQNSTDFLLVDNGNNTATIQALKAFDRETVKQLYLPVVITDSGSPPISATSTLTITIGDENDNPHRGGHKEVYINLFGVAWSPAEIGKVFAPDEDDWDNKTYTSVSQMPAYFWLNQNNGSLIMVKQPHQGIYNLKIKVSDGVWPDVLSTVRIHVKEIQNEAIHNSVSLRLTNITAEEFIQKDEYGVSRHDQLHNVLAEVLSAHPSNVHIISLTNTDGRQTDLGFSVHGTSTYYKPDILQNALSTHREEIQSILKAEMSQVEIDFCLLTGCWNSRGCTPYDHVREPLSLVDGGSVSYVSVTQHINRVCRCSATARFHHSCSSLLQNPCLNGGTCRDTINGYRCHCLPQFHGPLCQQTQRSFHGSGYAWFAPIRLCTESHLSLEFITDVEDGLILYSGPLYNQPLGKAPNFITIEITKSVPILLISQESRTLQLQFPRSVNVTDGKWHRIDMRMKKKEVQFVLDRCSSSIINEKEGTGDQLLTEDRTSCEVSGSILQETRFWNPPPVLHLGGVKESSPHSYPHLPHKSFKGCLRNVIMDRQMYDLGAPLESANSSPGCSMKDSSCESPGSFSSVCENQSNCVGESGSPNCNCTPYRSGHECAKGHKEHFFRLGSSIHYLFPHVPHLQRTHFQAVVRTHHADSTILSLTSQDKTEYIHLQVMHGFLTVSYNLGDGDYIVQLDHKIDTGEWHEVSMERMQNEFMLRVNEGGEWREITAAQGMYKEIKIDPSSVILGSSSSQKLGFQGCMKDARLNNYRLPMENKTVSSVSIIHNHGVSKGCTSKACESNPCGHEFICTDLWMMYKCSCPTGYLLTENSTGQHCIYTECAKTPCKHGTCVARSPAEFSCNCVDGYVGSKCDILLQTFNPGLGFSILFIICICFLAFLVMTGGSFLYYQWKKKKQLNEGVYHVSAYNDELEDTRQNIFHYNEEGGGEEDQDAFNMTELQLSLQSSPVQSLNRKTSKMHLKSPLSGDYDTFVSQKEQSLLPTSKPSCSFTRGDFGQYFYDIFQDAAHIQQALSCDSLKVYDMEGEGSVAGSLSTLASSGLDEEMEYEEIKEWGPKFVKLSKLYSYTEDDYPQ
ncbi:neural-cadherin-like [Rhinophrynus dorsalis]